MFYCNKYRIEPARCPKWEYSSPGYYFITAVKHDRRHLFGKIVNGKMEINEYGEIVYEEWYRTEQLLYNIGLYEFPVMPNHIHGIIRISPIRLVIREKQAQSPPVGSFFSIDAMAWLLYGEYERYDIKTEELETHCFRGHCRTIKDQGNETYSEIRINRF